MSAMPGTGDGPEDEKKSNEQHINLKVRGRKGNKTPKDHFKHCAQSCRKFMQHLEEKLSREEEEEILEEFENLEAQNRPHLTTRLTALSSHSPHRARLTFASPRSAHIRLSVWSQSHSNCGHSLQQLLTTQPTHLVRLRQERNNINSKGIEARVHRAGSEGTDEVYKELGSKFERLASERTPASDIGSSTKLEAVVEQVTELKNQQVQMLQFL